MVICLSWLALVFILLIELIAGEWARIRNACVKEKNIWRGYVNTIEQCKSRCFSRYNCRSIEFQSSSFFCHLSNATSKDIEYYEPCFEDASDWFFTEYDGWKDIRSGCIKGHNFDAVFVETIDECKLKCQQTANCRSIDFRGLNGLCHLSTESSASKHYVEPCYARGYVFTERVDLKDKC